MLREDLRKWCKEHKNPATGEPYNLYEDGLKIYTTINPRMQIYADEAVAKQLPILQKALSAQYDIRKGPIWKDHLNILEAAMRNSERWHNEEDAGMSDADIRKTFRTRHHEGLCLEFQTGKRYGHVPARLHQIQPGRCSKPAFMVMDPVTGAVKAWVGGIDFKTYKFDHVNINTKRQVGSCDQALPLQPGDRRLQFHSRDRMRDQSSNIFPGFRTMSRARQDKHEGGTITMASGLAWSINGVAAYIMKQVGPKRFAEYHATDRYPDKDRPLSIHGPRRLRTLPL